jgi:hypothetical protein
VPVVIRINVKCKTKALFMNNLLFKNDDNIMVASQDFLFHERRYLAMTPNMKEWVEQSNNLLTGISSNSKNDLPTVPSS